jgi:hypothetical protein
MLRSKCPPCLPVTYHPFPRFLACSPLTYQLSPRSGASGYQNRVHKNHEHLIICPQHAILAGFLSDRLSTWGKAAASCRHFAKTERAYLGNLATWPRNKPNADFIGQTRNRWAICQTARPGSALLLDPSIPQRAAIAPQLCFPLDPSIPRSLDPWILGARDRVARAGTSASDSLPSCPLAPSVPRSLNVSVDDYAGGRALAALQGDTPRPCFLDPSIPRSLDP